MKEGRDNKGSFTLVPNSIVGFPYTNVKTKLTFLTKSTFFYVWGLFS